MNLAHLRLCFPYRYQFSDACQQQMVTTFKWLKLLHGPSKDRLLDRLSRDIRISIAHFSLQLCDDPFEVKLRDNYKLREDELRESVKRKRMLDTKIEELRRTHPLLTQVSLSSLKNPWRISWELGQTPHKIQRTSQILQEIREILKEFSNSSKLSKDLQKKLQNEVSRKYA